MRGTGVVAALLATACTMLAATPVGAVEPPRITLGAIPPDGPPGPEEPTKQNMGCLAAGVLPGSDPARAPLADLTLGLDRARALSRGAGVTVAVIDTGVSAHPRLPGLRGGGDYVAAGGDGLADCDAHGTLVAGIIAAAPDPADEFIGVAPDAQVLSIRYRSGAFTTERSTSDPQQRLGADIRALARAITRAANMGAAVITVSLPICVPADAALDQAALATAIGHAVYVRGALIVAGAGNTNSQGCKQNPGVDGLAAADRRNWRRVETIATPAWFGPAVLTVGSSTVTGAPMPDSLLGPWVSVAAPGIGIESLGPGGGGVVNGVGELGKLVPVGGASFAAAYVSGVAALLRSRFPAETAGEIAARLSASAHAPARGVDNAVGAGVIDPVAALSFRSPPEAPAELFAGRSATLLMPEAPRARDPRPGIGAGLVVAAALLLGVAVSVAGRTFGGRT
ncbi:type VII secretion-associated serine protease mycosin [Nocardia brasiliensis]|uniref:type VII secretion-associated serine protease mycosin n=1 Tax=Nocardia brasiliensis TaxID=37326 RepID=UPI0024581033|nr:type VII secretion-associated serine protease mycosin [Nocardia brasiliensis]